MAHICYILTYFLIQLTCFTLRSVCQNILLSMMLFLFGSEGLINVKSALWIVVFLDYKDVLLKNGLIIFIWCQVYHPCFLLVSSLPVTFFAFFPSPFWIGVHGVAKSQTGQRLNNNNLGLCQHRIKFSLWISLNIFSF